MNLNYRAIGPWVRSHKASATTLVIASVLVGYGIVHAFSSGAAPATYVLATVSKGTLVASVTGNGQIAATNEVSLTPKTSGTLTYVASVNGKRVRTGTIIASMDAVSEVQAVQDAQLDLDAANITLKKLERSQTSDIPQRTDDVATAYADAYDDVFAAFQELPDIKDAVEETAKDGALTDACASSMCEHRTDTLQGSTRAEFDAAEAAYDRAYALYRATNRTSAPDSIAAVVDGTVQAAELLAQTLKAQQNLMDIFLDDLGDRPPYAAKVADLQQRRDAADGFTATLNRHASTLNTAKRDISDAVKALADTTDTGPLDLASQRNTVQRAQLSLQKARQALADRSVRAPFDGVVTGLDAHRGDSVSGSTALGSLITDQHVADLTFNEVDIAKLAVGQKATLTFDAVDGLTLTGSVADIDAIGTVTQGVVNYTVTIALDAQDARIKPGMSVGAAIVTDVRADALIIPIGAVKGSGENQYVQVPGATGETPEQRAITVGLTSDTQAEILSGLAEGDSIIARTVTASGATASQAPSLFQTGNARGGAGGGGTFRANIR